MPDLFFNFAIVDDGEEISIMLRKDNLWRCIHAVAKMDPDAKCPFCRVPPAHTSDEESIERVKKRMEMDDAEAIHNLGCCYAEGGYGMPQDWDKALELGIRRGSLVVLYHITILQMHI